MYEKALELNTVYKKPNFVLQVTPESVYQVLQVTWATFDCAKGHTIIPIVPSYTGKNITCLLGCILVIQTATNL